VENGNEEEIRHRLDKEIEIIGVANEDHSFTGSDGVVALASGSITMPNTSREYISRGNWIMAGLNPKSVVTGRAPMATLPVTPKTLREAPVDILRVRDVLETESTRDFFKFIMTLTGLMSKSILQGMVGKKITLIGDDVTPENLIEPEDLEEAARSVANITRLHTLDDGDNRVQVDSVGKPGENDKVSYVENVDKAADAMIRAIASNDYLLKQFNSNTLPLSGVLMSHIMSRIVAIALTSTAAGGDFDAMVLPTCISLASQL
jgi:hypothetical protein